MDELPLSKTNKRQYGKFRFYGGHLALDFVNTCEFRIGAGREEMFLDITDFLTWCRGVGLSPENGAISMGQVNSDDIERVRDLRDLLARLFDSAIDQKTAATSDIRVLNRIMQKAYANTEVCWTGEGYSRQDIDDLALVDRLLSKITRDAIDLLVGPNAKMIARCQDDRGCGWLFIDKSRKGNRRWCSMRECGNHAKIRTLRSKANRRPERAT